MLIFIFIISKQRSFYNSIKPAYDFWLKRYFAPYMPAWAGYTADVAALIYFMRWPKRFYLPMLHLIVSYSAYACAINGETKLPMVAFSVLLLAMLTIVGVDIYQAAVKGE